MSNTTPPPDETWTVGQAAAYLNAGGVDFKLDPRAVRRLVDNDPDCVIRIVSGGNRRWRRLLASTVHAERRRLLALAGRPDPADAPGPAAPYDQGGTLPAGLGTVVNGTDEAEPVALPPPADPS